MPLLLANGDSPLAQVVALLLWDRKVVMSCLRDISVAIQVPNEKNSSRWCPISDLIPGVKSHAI